MGEIVNLNKARKSKARSDAKAGAAENRARFGRSKADKAMDKAKAAQLERRLDQARRED